MTSRERVLAAFEFRPPDRIPRFDSFWDYPASWAERFGPAHDLTDISIWVPNEGTFPTRAGLVEETEDGFRRCCHMPLPVHSEWRNASDGRLTDLQGVPDATNHPEDRRSR